MYIYAYGICENMTGWVWVFVCVRVHVQYLALHFELLLFLEGQS